MKFEIDLVTQQHKALGFPVREAVPGQDPPERIDPMEATSRRRAVRQQTDALIDLGLKSSDPLGMAMELCACNTALAGSCVQLGIEPDYTDFAMSVIALIEKARGDFDRGLQVNDWEMARQGAAGLNFLLRGLAVFLRIPYEQVFQVMHEGYLSRQTPDMARIVELLRAAGYQIPDQTVGEGTAA